MPDESEDRDGRDDGTPEVPVEEPDDDASDATDSSNASDGGDSSRASDATDDATDSADGTVAGGAAADGASGDDADESEGVSSLSEAWADAPDEDDPGADDESWLDTRDGDDATTGDAEADATTGDAEADASGDADATTGDAEAEADASGDDEPAAETRWTGDMDRVEFQERDGIVPPDGASDEEASADAGDDEEVDAEDDSSTGGIRKAGSADRERGQGSEPVEPQSRHVDEPGEPADVDDAESGDERPDGEADVVVGPDADESVSVPNRGVEAGFEDPEDPPEKYRPEHPDKRDSPGGSDVPVGHAAGAARPGEATPAPAGAGASTGTGTGRTIEDDEELFEGPPDDEEMPLADHIEEMMLRLLAVVFAGAGATVLMYLYADTLVIRMWNDILPAGYGAARPHLYAPLEFVLTKIKVASLAGILIALPVLVYQSYLFMRPGLYPQERKYYLAAVPTSLVLAAVGMAFAYFAVLPGLFQYFDYYTEGNAVIAYGLQSTFNLIVALMGLQAVVFQIPLFVMLAIMMGVTTRSWLESRRLLFWGAFGGIAFLFAPDPTGMAPFIIALSMIVLFEGTLALLRWTGR